MPARFPDGVPLDRKAYPWMPVGLVRFYFRRLKPENMTFLDHLRKLVPSILLWWVMPAALLPFLWQSILQKLYLKQPVTQNDIIAGVFLGILFFGSLSAAFWFQRLMRRTLTLETVLEETES